MGKRVFDFIYERFGILWCVVFLFLTMFFSDVLSANQPQMDNLSKTEVVKNVQKIRIPFIANEGPADVKVAYYANTFGGTVFVTKDGEIVYSMPKALGVESSESKVESSECRGELYSPDVIHDGGCGKQVNHKSGIKS